MGSASPRLDLRARAFALAVGRALQDDRQRPIVDDAAHGGAIDVGGKADAVAHRDHRVAMHRDIVGERRRVGRTPFGI